MSHHFDTPTAQADPRINCCDFYVFEGAAGSTVLALTVNPDAGGGAPDTFREDEAIYAFRIDVDRDAREEVTFKVRFGPPEHDETGRHVQPFDVIRAVGPDAVAPGWSGVPLIAGRTGTSAVGPDGVKGFAGLAPDLFAGDGVALGIFRKALFTDGRFDATVFSSRKNLFERRNVTAIVLEVPTDLIGSGLVHAWATVSLFGHAPEIQVSRWGLPLITNFFMPEADMKEAFNGSLPHEDQEKYGPQIHSVVQKITALANSAADPEAYAAYAQKLFLPAVLPYELGTKASFDVTGFNGRHLADDVMDVILTLTTNLPIGDGVAPDRSRIRPDFPYFGAPYSAQEQDGLAPIRFGRRA